MKYVFIMNPIAGKTDVSERLIPQLKHIQELNPEMEYEVELTEYQAHAQVLAAKHAAQAEQDEEVVRIYACGGDGTLNEVMAGVYGCRFVEVGCLPYGTGNDYIKNFGEAADFQDLDKSINGTSIDVDIIETTQGIAAEVCTMGFDANVGYNTRHYKKLPFCHGKMAYNLSVVESILQPIGSQFRIVIDEEVIQGQFLMVCIANGTTYGGGFKCAPDASVCDGELDIIIVSKVSRRGIAKIISKYSDGSYQKNGEVIPEYQHCIRYLKGRNISVESPKSFISQLDGECQQQAMLKANVVPKGIRFILPEGMEYAKKRGIDLGE